jgi:ketosteroid isomerase-like protein
MACPGDSRGMGTDASGLAREYYRRIDGGAYGALRDLLADGFVQHRPDMTLEGADRFVAFMRDERPETDTTHVVEHVYHTTGTGPGASTGTDPDAVRVAVEGRLERANGETWFRFLDTFLVRDGLLRELRTYTF